MSKVSVNSGANLDRLDAIGRHLVPTEPEAVSSPVQITSPADPNFNGYDFPTAYLDHQEELKVIETLNDCVDSLHNFIPFIYSYRCITIAMNNGLNYLKHGGSEIETPVGTIFNEVFKPYLQKMIDLKDSVDKSIVGFIKSLKELETIPTWVLYQKIIDYFDVIFNIDHMKLIKKGLTNDLSTYRRNVKREEAQQLDPLIPFYSTPYQSLNQIKEKVKADSEITKKLIDFLDYCLHSYNNDFLLTKQKHSIVISIVSTLYIIGSKSLFSKDNIIQACSIVAENPIIPLYAELSFPPGQVLKKSDGFSPIKNVLIADNPKEISQACDKAVNLSTKLPQFREQFKKILPLVTAMESGESIELESVVNIVNSLSEMSSSIMIQAAYKSVCMAKTSVRDATNYDLQVKYNYSAEDLENLVELIGLIKTLCNASLRATPEIMKFVYPEIAHIVQNFFQNVLEKPLARAMKNKSTECIERLTLLRNMFCQWGNTVIPNKLDEKKLKKHDVSRNLVPPTIHQIDLMTMQLLSMIQNDSIYIKPVKKGKPIFSQNTVKKILDFLSDANKWKLVLQFETNIISNSNLSALYFRETALDIEGVTQFPVRSSLPFILAEHILSVFDKPALHEMVFFPFDIYNDAAFTALNTFKSQYLYREIEAETELCIDMISFTFARAFYTFCRESSAAAELPPECASQIVPSPIRFSLMVKQNTLSLLGSPVNFNSITTAKLNNTILKELESIIESITDFRFVPFYNHLFKVIKTTHKFLMKHGLNLDPFKNLWHTARQVASINTENSKLSLQMISIIDPSHWIYNSASRRFLPTKHIHFDPPNSEEWAAFYAKLHKPETKFIGVEHIASMIELLDDTELAFLIENCMSLIKEEIYKVIDIYIKVVTVISILPPKSKDELTGYFNFVSDAYNQVKHPQLGQLFHSMRIVGNLVAMLNIIESELPPTESDDSLMSTVFMIIRACLEENKELFIPIDGFDTENIFTHRTFASLWCVLEFLICSPSPIYLSESTIIPDPLESFGDGIILCAHLLIQITGTFGIYNYDSICAHALKLYDVQMNAAPKGDLAKFISYAGVVDQNKTFVESLVQPLGTLLNGI